MTSLYFCYAQTLSNWSAHLVEAARVNKCIRGHEKLSKKKQKLQNKFLNKLKIDENYQNHYIIIKNTTLVNVFMVIKQNPEQK